MADVIVNGFQQNKDTMPGPLLNVLQSIESMAVQHNQVIVKDKASAYVIPKMNLHVMSKAYLQSDNFKKFIDHVTA
jgi:hypothetical protein